MHRLFFSAATVILGLLCFTSCSDDETDIGLELQDPSTLFQGQVDTAYGVACTIFDDSLITSGQSSALVGCYQDNIFGTSEAVIYTQVYSPNDEGVEFDQFCTIDSVVLSLSVASIYNAGSKSYHNLHFEVYQLADTLSSKSVYYSSQTAEISSTCFFNDVVRLADADTMVVSLKLRPAFAALLSNHTYATADDFAYAIKGLRIRLVNDGNPTMATINLTASSTRLTAYYTYNNGNDSIYRSFEFTIGSAPHFNHYSNNYIGSLATFNNNVADSVDGARYLYLSPMGGTNVKINFDSYIRQFKQQHPYAVIHYAELLLPVADIAMSTKPELLAALRYNADSANSLSSIPDLYDPYTYSGYDGTYNSKKNCFRIRITQQWQELINRGQDLGTLLVINGRRTSAAHTVLNGYNRTQTGDNPIRVAFVYSEL